MSADSQGDAANLKKDEESPTAIQSEGIPIASTMDDSVGRIQIDADQNTLTPATKPDALLTDYIEENDEKIETIIEKQLSNEKEKGLDVDSELDFELKWDDDTDLNEDQIDNAYKEIESTLTSTHESPDSVAKTAEIIPTCIQEDHGHAEQEIEKTLTSIDEGFDSVSKHTTTTSMSIEKYLDNEEKEIGSELTSIDEGLDSESKDIDTTSTSIEKDLDSEEKEIGSTLTSIDEGLDSVSKDTDTTSTSIEKDLDNEEKKIGSMLTSIDKGLDSVSKDTDTTSIDENPDNEEKEIRSTLTSTSFIDEDLNSVSKDTDTNLSVEKDLENAGKKEEGVDGVGKKTEIAITSPENLDTADKEIEGNISSKEKQLGSADHNKETTLKYTENDDDLEKFVSKINDNINTNTEIDTVSMDIDKIDGETQSTSENDVLMQSDELSKTDVVSGNEDETFNVDTGAKIDLETNLSPTVSETNSLDEQLVYSDAEVPDIADKDLMDEIDAQITETEKSTDELGIMDCENSQVPQEASQRSKENEVCQKKLVSEMDVDNSKDEINKTDLNLTCSSEMETSTYDINNEHKLDRPDAMIEIPTQELFESIDDFAETSDVAEDGKDILIDVINKPDFIENATSKELKANLTVSHTTEDKTDIVQSVPDKDDIPKDVFNTLLKDQVEIAVDIKKSADVVAKIESMDIDTSATDETNKPDEETISAGNSNLETQLQPNEDDVFAIEGNIIQADIILEANSEQPKKLTVGKASATPELQTETSKEYSSENEDLKGVEVSKNTDIDPQTSTSIDRQDLSDEAQPATSKDCQELSDEAQTSTSKDCQELSDEAQPFISKDFHELSDEAQPATSKDCQELSDEAQPATSKDCQELSDEAQPFISKDFHELSDEAQPATSKDCQELSDEAQPSISKDFHELSDEAQLSTSKDFQELSDRAQPSTSKDFHELSDEAQSSTTKDCQELSNEAQPSTSKDCQELSDEAQPSTSKDHQELSDEDQELTDSLGLLAESSRVMDDEDEQEPEPEDDDDDDDFDQDDESNQMTAEHSEDSNAQHSETDVPKSMEVDESNDTAEPQIDVAEADMEAGDVQDDNEVYEDAVDESSADKDFQIQIDGVVSGKPDDTEIQEIMETAVETQDSIETQNAVDALLEDKTPEETSDAPEAVSVDETVKVSDSDSDTGKENSKLRALLLKESSDSFNELSEAEKKSPSKTKRLEISKPKVEINIVELEESSSEDDVQMCTTQDQPESSSSPKEVTSAITPNAEVMATSAGKTTDIEQKKEVISGSKAVTRKPSKLNDKEASKTVSPAESESLAIPETTAPKTPDAKTPIDLGLEIFSLDSDDEDTGVKSKRKKKLTAVEIDKARETNKCINMQCTSDASVPLVPASISATIYYAANQQRGIGLCLNCAQRMEERSKKLIEGVKDLTPYLNMDMCMIREELVEISDSDSDDDTKVVKKDDEVIGEKGAKFLEEQLTDVFNETWKKYDMEARLLTAQTEISIEVRQLEEECKKIDAMLQECQTETDKLRNDLYDTFADERKELPSIAIYDTPITQWSGLEEAIPLSVDNKESRQAKRRLPPPAEPPAKRPPIPLGYAPLDSDANKQPQETKPTPAPPAEMTVPPEDDNADISVVKLSVEAAPAGLPPPGVATRPPLRPGVSVYAMRNTFGAWHKVRIVEVHPKVAGQFTMCRVRFEHPKNATKVLPARCLAYEHPPDVRLTIGTRVVALFKDHRNLEEVEKKESYYSGIVAEIPNPVNNYRYLIFFDDGYAQYVQHAVTRLVCECAPRVWDEVHPFSRQFVRDYLRAYPERPMVRLHAGQSIKTEWNGKWWPSKVIQVDASLVHVFFEGKKEAGVDKTEWIYRGSTRLAPLYLELQAAERQRARPLPRAQAGRRFNMPYVEYTRSDEAAGARRPSPPPPSPRAPAAAPAPAPASAPAQAQMEQDIRRQRAVAKKSTAVAPPQPARDNVTSRVVYYSPKNAIKPHKWVPHTCGPQCKRTDVLALKDLRTYNPLTKPLLSGWERHTLRFRAPVSKTAMYRAPCGRRIRNHRELHHYLQAIESDMSVDLFDFNGSTHCLAEFVLNKCIVSKKDLSHGKENVPVPCVNYYDDSLPEFCSYNTERTPTAGVPLNIDPEFLCGCDCTDDCADKSKCACWKMTLEGARTIGLDTNEVGYVYKRLPEPLPSGIYECNARCKCRQTCLNRVAQHPLQLKLQVFKTANRGWGIRALNDVPKGAFLCVYAGNLLTDATANLDGLNEGDEYLAELDYIEVVEQMKEGFEEDIPDDAKKLDQDDESTTSASSSSSDDEPAREDDDFRPAMPTGHYTPSEYSKRLRKREKSKKAKEKEERDKKVKAEREKNSEECITISDDEELREPARFAARAGMGGKEFVSKYKSVRAHFGKDEACYIMDAKVQGNIGRYLNHSCTPNVFVQNVFVDTHDPRFPWVAFFALSHIKAGTELTWNYNYDVGSVPGKVLYCYCNAPNCRGRLL